MTEKDKTSDLSPNLDEAQRFLTLLDGQAKTFTFQTLTDDKKLVNEGQQNAKLRGVKYRDPLASILHGTIRRNHRELSRLQEQGAGVFVMVQKGDGHGRTNATVTRIRAVFVEDDGDSAGMVYPVEPHIVVESSPGKRHIYFLVDGLAVSEFRGVQERLIADWGSDPNAKDPARTLRVPGFWHLKDRAQPHHVRILETSERPPYSRNEILAAFPPLEKKKSEKSGSPHPPGADGGTISKGGRNAALTSIAGKLRRSGMSVEAIAAALFVENDRRCDPPLDADEVEAIAQSIGRYEAGTTHEKPLIYYKNGDPAQPRLLNHSKAAKALIPLLNGLAYDSLAGHWIEYRGGIFERITEARAKRAVLAAIDTAGGDDDPRGYSDTYAAGIQRFLQSHLLEEGFDQQPGLLPFENGVLDTLAGELRPHSPAYKFTWKLPYPYVQGGDCLPVIDWLRQAAGGEDEVQVIRAFIRAMLTGRADLQRYLEIQGPPGSGKGSFLRLLTELVGEKNNHTTTMKQLETNRFETANLRGKRLVQITDAERYQGDTAILRAVTGDDYLPYEAKNRQGGESFRFGGMVVIAANNATTHGDYSGALHRRRVTIRFDHVVDPSQHRNLGTEFKPYLSGVITWALAMPEAEMEAMLRDTERQSERMARASLLALFEVNPVARWANESLVAAPGHEIRVGVKRWEDGGRSRIEDADQNLYPAYAQWCLDHGQKDLGAASFTSALESALCQQLKLPGVQRLKNTNGKGSRFVGVRLRTENDNRNGHGHLIPDDDTPPAARTQYEHSTAGTLESTGSMGSMEKIKTLGYSVVDGGTSAGKSGESRTEKIHESNSGGFARAARAAHTPRGFQPCPPSVLPVPVHAGSASMEEEKPWE